MNLVGPRAEDPRTVAEWPEEICREILSVRPGLTGPASVLYTYFDNLLQSQNVIERSLFDFLPTRLRLDQLYVRRRSLLTDLDVLSWTALSLLPRLRFVPFPEALHPSGVLRLFFSPNVFGFLSDFMAAFLAAAIAGSLFPAGVFLISGTQSALGISLILALIFSLANLFNGSHKVNWDQAPAGESLDLAISTTLTTLLLAILNLVVPGSPVIAPWFLGLTSMLAFAGFMFLRYRERLVAALASAWARLRGYSLARFGEPVLIAGGGETGRYTLTLLRDSPLAQAYNVVGIVDDDPGKLGASIDGVKVIGTTGDIPALSKALDIGLVFFAINEIDPGESRRIARLCRGCGARMIRVPDVMNQLRSYFPREEGDQTALISTVLQDSTHDRLTGAYNRQTFLRHLERELSRSEGGSQPCSLIGFEVDYQWPDGIARSRALTAQVLQVVAERTLKFIRRVDVFGRVGENEFAVFLPQINALAARRLADRLHRQLRSAPIWTDHGPLNITLAMAVVSQTAGEAGAEKMIEEVHQKIQAEKPVDIPSEEFGVKPISTSTYRQSERRP
jgi:diguanylate cyclase (GGDEF)-like protein